MKHLVKILTILTLLALLPGAAAQDMVELDFMCYENGNECSVFDDLLSRFSEDNPGITVTVNTVPYTTVRDQLRVQVEAGQAPDIARITDFAGMAGFYLDLRPLMEDPSLMEESFPGAILEAFRTDDDMSGLYGFPDAATVTAPFVNATLFEQAGIEMPSATMDEPTWEDWLAALDEVASATGVQYAMAIDNKGTPLCGTCHEPGRRLLR